MNEGENLPQEMQPALVYTDGSSWWRRRLSVCEGHSVFNQMDTDKEMQSITSQLPEERVNKRGDLESREPSLTHSKRIVVFVKFSSLDISNLIADANHCFNETVKFLFIF